MRLCLPSSIIIHSKFFEWNDFEITNIEVHYVVSQEFLEDYEHFKDSIADLDRRLASIVCQGFDDCSGLEASFKVRQIYIKGITFEISLHLS